MRVKGFLAVLFIQITYTTYAIAVRLFVAAAINMAGEVAHRPAPGECGRRVVLYRSPPIAACAKAVKTPGRGAVATRKGRKTKLIKSVMCAI